MRKFTITEVIMTDDEGFLILKGILPKGSIKWSRAIGNKVVVLLSDDVNIQFLEKQLNSIHRNLNM